MNDRRVLKVGIFFEKGAQRLHINRIVVIRGEQNRLSTVHTDKIREPLAEDAVIEYQNPISRLCQTRAGRFQTQNAFSAQNVRAA